ncbi:MAG TPA: ABC transporter permease [Solirubrobacteraceae bacterium]|nr:ABC transporter permease [Solirubrobacteraceae bacterium]
MSARNVLSTARRVLAQLRHDPRTVALVLFVPCVLMTLLRFVYEGRRPVFDAAGAPLLTLFPLMTMFLVTSVALLRERTTGTLERLLTTPLGKLELLLGYGLAFGVLATAQVAIAFGVSLGPLGLHVAASRLVLALLCVLVALLGMGLGLLASAFARTEFQVVQFLPATIVPQLLLCGLLTPRDRMQSVLHAISDAMPMSYAVDAVHHLSREPTVGGALWGDLAIVVGFAAVAIALGAATLQRRTE